MQTKKDMTNIKEIWKPIHGYDGIYEISNFGKVKRVARLLVNKNGHSRRIEEKQVAICVHKQGHHVVRLWKENKTRLFTLYRLMAIAFIPNPENKREVNHINGDRKSYPVLSNLEWVTASENMKHAYKNGLSKGNFKAGFEHQLCKMSFDKIQDLISLRNSGMKFKDIALHFGITHEHAGKLYKKHGT